MTTRTITSQFRFTSLLTLLFYICMALNPSLALCQDPAPGAAAEEPEEYMVTLHEGESAPFDGTLLNVPAAARILTDLRLREEECRIETDRRIRILTADMQLRIDTEVARREALQYRHDQLISIKDEQIDFLTANIRPPEWHQTGEFWYALGFVSGIALTVLAGYAVSLAAGGP